MTANLDYLNVYASNSSTRSDRPIESVRVGGWLRELERAQLSVGEPKHVVVHNSLDAVTEDRSVQAADSMGGENPMSHPDDDALHGKTGDFSSIGSNMHAIQATKSKDKIGMPTAEQSAAGTFSDKSASSDSGSQQAIKTLNSSQQVGVTLTDERTVQLAPEQPSVLSSPVVLPALGLTSLADDGLLTQSVVIKASNGLSFGTLSLFNLPDHPVLTEDTASKVEENTADESTDSQQVDMPENGEPYSERQLHLFHGADGVQAWIRDTALSELHAYSVAQALGNELGDAGFKLSSLTLNGKKRTEFFPENTVPVGEETRQTGKNFVVMTDARSELMQYQQKITKKGAY
jgi:hypothetical protein